MRAHETPRRAKVRRMAARFFAARVDPDAAGVRTLLEDFGMKVWIEARRLARRELLVHWRTGRHFLDRARKAGH